jgi:hypothetical protein
MRPGAGVPAPAPGPIFLTREMTPNMSSEQISPEDKADAPPLSRGRHGLPLEVVAEALVGLEPETSSRPTSGCARQPGSPGATLD